MMNMMEQSVAIRLTHSGPAETTLVLEPWGEIHRLPPNCTLDIVGEGPDGDTLEVEATGDGLVVYGWPGSVVNIYRDGIELDPGSKGRPRAPGFDAMPKKNASRARHPPRRRAQSGA